MKEDGGEKVFLLIGRLAANPQEHLPVLEVMLHILGLGFEGHYRTQADGHRMVETIRNRLYGLVANEKEAVPRELSPHWHDAIVGQFRLLRSVPVWATACVLGLILVGLFSWYKYHLVGETQTIERTIREISKHVPPMRRLRLKELLVPEIAAGHVDVEENADHSKVTFRGDDMFMSGQAKVNASIYPMLEKVAAGINEVSGHVEVTGHSDNRPITRREFSSNQMLSEKRAQAVAQILQENHVDMSRISINGVGDTQPIADNGTAAGRARNRRVEIEVRSQ